MKGWSSCLPTCGFPALLLFYRYLVRSQGTVGPASQLDACPQVSAGQAGEIAQAGEGRALSLHMLHGNTQSTPAPCLPPQRARPTKPIHCPRPNLFFISVDSRFLGAQGEERRTCKKQQEMLRAEPSFLPCGHPTT